MVTHCKKSSQGADNLLLPDGGLLIGNHLEKNFCSFLHKVQVYVLLHIYVEAICHKSWAETMSFGDRKGPSDAVVEHFELSLWGMALNASSYLSILNAVQELTLP